MPDDGMQASDELDADIDRSDTVRHASEEARAQAIAHMRQGGQPEVKPLQTAPRRLTQVKIYSPFHVYYDQPATSISATNGTGPFDILPGHQNFLTLLSKGDVVVRAEGGKTDTFTIERGVMHVHKNAVKVFLDV